MFKANHFKVVNVLELFITQSKIVIVMQHRD